MALYSNESYISDYSLNIILHDIKPDKMACMNAFVDQYIFISEWFLMYRTSNDILGYFDIISKYIYRCHLCLQYLPALYVELDKNLVLYSKKWKDEIRGKMPLDKVRKSSEYSVIVDYLSNGIKTVDRLFDDFHKIFKKVELKLYDKSSDVFLKKLHAEIKKVNVSLENTVIKINKDIV
jgi:hypothetical protein